MCILFKTRNGILNYGICHLLLCIMRHVAAQRSVSLQMQQSFDSAFCAHRVGLGMRLVLYVTLIIE